MWGMFVSYMDSYYYFLLNCYSQTSDSFMSSLSSFQNVISCSSFNARGLKDAVKRKAVFLFCKGLRSNILFLQETHSDKSDARFWSQQWGGKIIFSHGSNRSAGVAICFNKFLGEIVLEKTDNEGHWVMCVLKIEKATFILINVYGYNNEFKNKTLLYKITNIIEELKTTYMTDLVVVGGDFNMVADECLDRWPTKYLQSCPNPIISNFMNENGLLDVWRDSFPNTKQFTWLKPNGNSKSRIDFWLVSTSIMQLQIHTSNSINPLSDRCVISLVMSSQSLSRRRKDYWKFNSSLLRNEFCSKIKELISDTKNNTNLSNIQKWEYLKFLIRKFSITFSKKLQLENKAKENNLIKSLLNYYSKVNWSEEDKIVISNLQTQLDQFYLNKAKGAFIRSRSKWIEEGEKNSSFFFRLEKRRQENNTILCLLINGEECINPKSITREIYKYYSKMYSSSYNEHYSKDFFQTIEDKLPKIENHFKELCEESLKLAELDEAVKNIASDRSPGPDGLTANFYKHFWEEIRDLLFNAITESITQKELMTTMKQGVIKLIPKPEKDKRLLNNFRPITLLNTDYKIFTTALAIRLKNGLPKIISNSQSGFMKGRSIHNNIRMVLDLIDYSDLIR